MKHFFCMLLLCSLSSWAQAEPLRIAVAANFQNTFDALVAAYPGRAGNPIEPSYGASGMLYTQITSGAPFVAFFSADDELTLRLVEEKRAIAATQFIYAIGHLSLWVPGATSPPNVDWLSDDAHRIAIANPEIAPYGRAAQETLTALSLWQQAQPRLVLGNSVSQVMQFIASGSVPGGLVADAQLISHFHGAIPDGEVWQIPERLHVPIVQEAVALDTPAAARVAEFFAFVVSDDGRAIIESSGYSVLVPVKSTP